MATSCRAYTWFGIQRVELSNIESGLNSTQTNCLLKILLKAVLLAQGLEGSSGSRITGYFFINSRITWLVFVISRILYSRLKVWQFLTILV